MRKILIGAGVVIGVIILAVAFHYAGVGDIQNTLLEGSLFFLLIFLASSLVEFFVIALKWYYIVKSEGGSISFKQAFSYRLMGQSLNYITPAARMGGSPWMAYLLKKHCGMRMSRGLSTVLIDRALELGVELVLGSAFVFAIILFVPLPAEIKMFGIIFIAAAILFSGLFFIALLKDWKPLSAVFRLFARISKHRIVQWAKEKAVKVERYMRLFFRFRKRDSLRTIGLNSFVWAFRFLEYKLALLVFGYDASPALLFGAMLIWGLAGLVPIPAALGVLEAGQMSLFVAFGAKPDIGLALALALRARDILFTLSGIYLMSHEGVGIVEAIKKTASNSKSEE
ncbi:MAG: lysylphosphatidylglycerol synthase transmembrane domain-containing protein [Candidatus Woesearchaeota archaeon]